MQEDLSKAKQVICDAKNICIVADENEKTAVSSALALFYTLKELNKNVNLIIQDFPKELEFLIPSMDFISYPKNFVISIPRDIADISRIYYEKNDDNLKIHLTMDKGKIKKENISFYFSEAIPDIVIAVGIKNFRDYLSSKLDSYGFLIDSPVINIDSQNNENLKFGSINLLEHNSLPENALAVINFLDPNLPDKNSANCLLAGIICHYNNFKSKDTSPEAFELAASLIKKGASRQNIIENIYKSQEYESDFLGQIFQKINSGQNNKSFYSLLNSPDFQKFGETQAESAVEKIKTLGIQNNLLVLWESHASDPLTKGFFYSKNPDLLNLASKNFESKIKDGWIYLSAKETDLNLVKEKILGII